MNQLIRKLVQVPYAFMLMNGAVVAGLFYFARGHQTFWNSVPVGVTPEPIRHA